MIAVQKIEKAVQFLRVGGLVAFPTETVYGLGADAHNETALFKIFSAKNRPTHHPLIVHIANTEALSAWALEIPDEALKLAAAFWPGPLTLILKKKPAVSKMVTGGQETVGLRVPRHKIAQALLSAFGSGIAAPSANQFTRISPTSAQAVLEELGDKVDYLLEGGICEVGLESTIIDLSSTKPILLRPGGISKVAIEAVLDMTIDYPGKTKTRTPGMHSLHYAPRTHTHLLSSHDLTNCLSQLKANDLPVMTLTRTPIALTPTTQIKQIRMPTNPDHYARALYQTLREADKGQYQSILIETVPEEVEWDAIRDRLTKASSGR